MIMRLSEQATYLKMHTLPDSEIYRGVMIPFFAGIGIGIIHI